APERREGPARLAAEFYPSRCEHGVFAVVVFAARPGRVAQRAPGPFVLRAEFRARAGEAGEITLAIDRRDPQVRAHRAVPCNPLRCLRGRRDGALVDVTAERKLRAVAAELEIPAVERQSMRHAERQRGLVELVEGRVPEHTGRRIDAPGGQEVETAGRQQLGEAVVLATTG